MKKVLKVIYLLLIIVFCVLMFYICKGYHLYKDALKKTPLNEKIAEIKSKENYYSVSNLPQIYKNAVISVEDHRFYKHFGIDIIAIGRAIKNNIKEKSFVEGGSTITQQLAKNIYFTQDKTIERKVAEMFMAFKLERTLEKNEILELYLNTSYFGEGSYTVKEASLTYFKKEPQDMIDSESVMLAGLPNAPSVYSPLQNFDLAKQRQKQVLNKMVYYKYLTKEEANTIYNEEI